MLSSATPKHRLKNVGVFDKTMENSSGDISKSLQTFDQVSFQNKSTVNSFCTRVPRPCPLPQRTHYCPSKRKPINEESEEETLKNGTVGWWVEMLHSEANRDPLPWPVPVPSVTTERRTILRPLVPRWTVQNFSKLWTVTHRLHSKHLNEYQDKLFWPPFSPPLSQENTGVSKSVTFGSHWKEVNKCYVAVYY